MHVTSSLSITVSFQTNKLKAYLVISQILTYILQGSRANTRPRCPETGNSPYISASKTWGGGGEG